MPIHDWSRVDAGIFHYFHQRWLGTICDALNDDLLPEDYYALAEQRAGVRIPDVLTLTGPRGDRAGASPARRPTGATVRDRPTATYVVETDAEVYLRKQTEVTIRHVSDDRVVALVEVLSPGNKSGRVAFEELCDKVIELLRAGVNRLLIDLIPRTKRDARGIHAVIWDRIAEKRVTGPKKRPLTVVAYEAGDVTRGYYEPVAVGEPLPDMPLFLEYGWHVPVPLEATYATAYTKVPRRWRTVIEGG